MNRHVWLKRVGFSLLALILLVIAFHRPIIFEGTRYFILRAAKQQNLDVDYTISGSIFTTLTVSNLRATPVEPGPIQRLAIGRLHLRYSIWSLLRDGLPAFLSELHVRDVYVELEPGEQLPPDKEAEPQAFKFPALIPNVLDIQNLNVVVHATTGSTVVEGLSFSLFPDRLGVLKLETLDIPGVRRWAGISAETTFRDRNFVLSDVIFGPEIALRELRLDVSALDESRIELLLDGAFFGAPISLFAQVNDVNASNTTSLEIQVSALVVDRVWKYLNLDVPFGGTLQTLSVAFEGAPMAPSTWSGTLEMRASDVRISGFAAEDLRVAARLEGGLLILQELSLERGENTLRASAKYELPSNNTAWDKQPLSADFDINVPRLADFVIAGGFSEIGGALLAKGHLTSGADGLKSELDVTGRDLEFRSLRVRALDINLATKEKLVTMSRFELVLDDHNKAHGEGSVLLDGSMAYRGGVKVEIPDVSKLQSLVGDTEIAGGLQIAWQGTGSVQESKHEGQVDFALTNGRVGRLVDLHASFAAQYSPESIDLPNLYVKAGTMGEASMALFWKDGRMRITHLLIRQKQTPLLEGSIDIPLLLSKWKEPAELVPFDERVTVSLKSPEVQLVDVLRPFSQEEIPFRAITSFEVSANGTLDDLAARMNFRASAVKATAAEHLDPATVALSLHLKDDRVTIEGAAEQKLIQPLAITGSLPLDLAEVIRTGRLNDHAPLDLRVLLPRTSLAAIPTLVPDIRRSQGTASVDLRVSGTLQEPQWAGRMEADLSALRMTDPSLPPINDFVLRTRFAGTQLLIERGAGIIAGGTFSLSGNIDFTSPSNPVFGLRLGSSNALVLQNDDLSVRVSSALRVTGPLNAGTVEGEVWVTRSRFFRNIDILPIGLPGRPAPQPPAEPFVVSFPDPPLRDWKFDIRIRTQDPFLVQSNLATGRIVMDLRLGGTGLRPWLDGTVNVENLTASLPFSRLQITDGQVFFTQQEPFVPQLNLTGTSTIRDYDVNVIITGSAFEPEALFTSNPPLPQAEVVSLIATGMTTAELSDDPNALAGRAAFLAFQRLYNSVFHRGRPPPSNDSFLSRIQFDIGATDPGTGRQSTAIRVPLSDEIMLTGGLDVGGNFRGQVKYLIRFQ